MTRRSSSALKRNAAEVRRQCERPIVYVQQRHVCMKRENPVEHLVDIKEIEMTRGRGEKQKMMTSGTEGKSVAAEGKY